MSIKLIKLLLINKRGNIMENYFPKTESSYQAIKLSSYQAIKLSKTMNNLCLLSILQCQNLRRF